MRGVRFLVVDDSPMVVKMISGVIRNNLGSDKILTAADGREAIQKLEKNPVDMIVSDWNMTGMNGDELLYYVRNHGKLKDIPFVMVTSNSQKDFIITALQLGVTQYLIKPFTPAELEKKIRNSWNAANKRASERYSALPPHRAALKIRGLAVKVQALDVSRNGVQLLLDYHDQLNLYEKYELVMAFQNEETGEDCCVISVKGEVTRMEANRKKPPTCFAALIFDMRTFGMEEGKKFEQLLDLLANRTPNLIDNS